MQWLNKTHIGDCRELLGQMAADGVKVQMAVTSPPYYGLRDYGVEGQIGLETSLEAWIASLVEAFRGVWDVLADDGTLWLNLGDAYAGSGRGGYSNPETSTLQGSHEGQQQTPRTTQSRRRDRTEVPRSDVRVLGLKPKDLMGQPWRVALALQADGWYLRRDIIWHKPNPMPESAKDRPTTAHEYIFLLSKSERYYYDAAAICEPVTGNAHSRGDGVNPKARATSVAGWEDGPGKHKPIEHARPRSRQNASFSAAVSGHAKFSKAPERAAGSNLLKNTSAARAAGAAHDVPFGDTRNARSVWTIPTEPTSFAHFACFPREIPKRCILAGSRPGDVVLDPFMGSGTVAQEAESLGRQFIGCELNPDYLRIQEQHRKTTRGLPL